jgi:hypothetical protein
MLSRAELFGFIVFFIVVAVAVSALVWSFL